MLGFEPQSLKPTISFLAQIAKELVTPNLDKLLEYKISSI